MDIKDLFLDDELVVGEECYFEHKKYIYQGFEDGKHVVKAKNKDEEITKYLNRKPLKPKLPVGIYLKDNRGQSGELTGYVHMGEMYYKITLYNNVFKEYELVKLENILKEWSLIKDPYWDDETVCEELDKIDSEIYSYQKQIKELQGQIDVIERENIKPLKEKKEEIYNKCKHDWLKYDEEEISKGSFQQECECQKCGRIKYNRYLKLF